MSIPGVTDSSRAAGAESHANHLRRLEELGRLAGAVAHDFNNLLTVIRSYAQLMLDQAAAGPSVVLADVATPDDAGWAFAEWLREARPGLPVVLMSALDWGRLHMSMPPNVPVPVLQKPFSAADLIAALRAALEWGALAAAQR